MQQDINITNRFTNKLKTNEQLSPFNMSSFLPSTTPSPALKLGSTFLFVQNEDAAEQENIYAEDLADGIASCAKEQAEVWKLEMEEEEEGASPAATSPRHEFKRAMKALVNECLQENRTGKRRGACGTTSRQQPRNKPGAARRFDDVVRQNEAVERKLVSKTALSGEAVEAFRTLLRKGLQEPGFQRYARTTAALALDNPVQFPEGTGEVIVVVPREDMTQAGFGGDDAPRAVFPSIVGRPKHHGIMVGMDQKDAYIGDEAQSKRGVLSLKYPVQRGMVRNFDDFEKVMWHCFYNELRVVPEEHPVVMADTPLTPSTSRERLVQIMFETFNVPALCVVSAPYLGLLSTGRSTGIVVEISASLCTILPVVDGIVDPAAVVIMPIGANDVVSYMTKILTERGYFFTTTAERDIVRDITEKMCFVEQDYASPQPTVESTYELPDGQGITIGSEKYRCVEPLFSPILVGIDCPSVPESVLLALVRSPADQRAALADQIVVTGNLVCRGFAARVESDLKRLVPRSTPVRVRQSPESKYSAWIGGSVAHSYLQWITREDYDRDGPSVVHRACFAGGYSDEAVGYLDADVKSNTYEELLQKAAKEAVAATANIPVDESKPTAAKAPASQNIVMTKPLATTNCALLQTGLIIAESGMAPMDDVVAVPTKCPSCTAVLLGKSCPVCESTGRSLREARRTFLLAKPAAPEGPPRSIAAIPIIVFVVDVSGSMGITTTVPGGLRIPTGLDTSTDIEHVPRLKLVQAAIRSRLLRLQKESPETIPVLVSFGSSVEVHFCEGEGYQMRSSEVNRLHRIEDFVAVGKRLMGGGDSGGKGKGTARSVEALVDKLYGLANSGCTALGPALALSAGLCSGHPGGQVIVCTDGKANVGIGSLNASNDARSQFYEGIGNLAIAHGITINTVTLEDCEAGMESLGTTADISGGSVAIVNPMVMTKEFAMLGNSPTVATNVAVKVVASRGVGLSCSEHAVGNTTAAGGDVSVRLCGDKTLHAMAVAALDNDAGVPESFLCPITLQVMNDPVLLGDGQSYERIVVEDWLENHSTSPMTNAPLTNKDIVPNIALRQMIEDWALQDRTGGASPCTARLQFQVSYKLWNGEERLTVIDREFPVTTSRAQAERYIESSVCAMNALQASANMSKGGEYLQSRVNLVSFQRLLQRTMRTKFDCQSYLAYITHAEPLDQFMREQAMLQVMQSNSIMSNTSSTETRDDDASKSLFQSKALSMHQFLRRATATLANSG